VLVAVVALVASSCVLDGDWEALAPVNPVPSGNYGLERVACPTTDFCMTIGSNPGAYAGIASVQTWDGTTWTESTFDPGRSDDPDFHGLELTDVACASETSCAVAWLELWDDEDLPWVSGWDGTGWTHRRTTTTDSSIFNEVACAPGGSCIAASDSNETVVWDGTSFSGVTGNGPYWLKDLACPTSTTCVGIYPDGFTQVWNGSTWTFAGDLPVPWAWGSIACTSPTSCLAVGSDAGTAVAAQFDGATWVSTPLPITAGGLGSVSCSSVIACVATGAVGTHPNTEQVALGWNGGDWYLLDDPPPAAGGGYTAISCAPGNRCVAVGRTKPSALWTPVASTYVWTDA
jgi:hypothetical protein